MLLAFISLFPFICFDLPITRIPLTRTFSDPESCSGRGLNLRPPAQQTGANPIELTGRKKKKVRVIGSRLYNLLLDASS